MRPTIEYAKAKFNEFNRKYFGGRLPDIKIELMDSGRNLGLCCWRSVQGPDGHPVNSDFKLKFNTRADLPEEEVESTIIHEMIHYFIALHNLVDTSPHGEIFRSVMRSLNSSFGLKLDVTFRNPASELREQFVSSRPTWRVIAIVEMSDGRTLLKVLPKVVPKIIAYHTALISDSAVFNIKLYLHNNPYFNRFPSSFSYRFSPVDLKFISEHLRAAHPLHIEGNRLVETKTRRK